MALWEPNQFMLLVTVHRTTMKTFAFILGVGGRASSISGGAQCAFSRGFGSEGMVSGARLLSLLLCKVDGIEGVQGDTVKMAAEMESASVEFEKRVECCFKLVTFVRNSSRNAFQ